MGCRPSAVILFIINMLFWIAGAAILIFSVLLQVYYSSYVVNEDMKQLWYMVYAFIAVGSFLTIVGFYGCLSACRGGSCVLGTYIVLLLIVIVVEVGGGLYIYANVDKFNNQLERSLQGSIQAYDDRPVQYTYGGDQYQNPNKIAVDAIQRELNCCGALGPRDWADSLYNSNSQPRSSMGMGISGIVGTFRVPRSCCVGPEDSLECMGGTTVAGIGGLFNAINSDGCAKKIYNLVANNKKAVLGFAIALIAVEVLAIILSFVLCCLKRRRDYYKE